MNGIPLHFIYGRSLGAHISRIDNVDHNWTEFIDGRQVWILQTYCILKKYYKNITLGNKPKSGAVNIIHASDTGFLDKIRNYYFVSIRADKRPVLWSNYEIVQNKCQEGPKTSYVTHWLQPGLLKRKRRKNKIEKVAFLGAIEQNILRNYPVEKDLIAMGISYSGMDRQNWNDYREIDIALAIRQFGGKDSHPDKPPSKLINAWWAEVPLIASNDSAYAQIGVPGADYITVGSYEEMIGSIAMLQNNPDRYRQIVQNGIAKRERYSRDSIVNEWIKVFENQVFPDFERWERLQGAKKIFTTSSRSIVKHWQRVSYKFMDLYSGR